MFKCFIVTCLNFQEKLKPSIAAIFALMHSSVSEMSNLMLEEVHRHNYVTPTNYLELVAGYAALLKEKHKELGDAATKLRNGLFKIDETRIKVCWRQQGFRGG